MRVSLSWIKRILGRPDLGVSVADLQARLTLHLAEFEADVERSGPNLDGVVVGRVVTCVQHPGADRLRCTTVDIGGPAPVPVVCGAPNVAVGQTVAVATIGAVFPNVDFFRSSGNIVIVGYDGPRRKWDELLRVAKERQEKYKFRYDLTELLERRYQPAWNKSRKPLTDDFAPVDQLVLSV